MSQPVRRDQQIRARRRTATRIGFLVIVALSATACIFDQSEYKGGGRSDKGATAQTASGSASGTASGTATGTSTGTPDASLPD